MIHYIYGLHAVSVLLQHTPQQVKQLFIQPTTSNPRVQKITQLAKQLQLRIQTTTPDALDKLAENGVHQGVIAELMPNTALTESDLMPLLDALTVPPFLLILDGVQDPHNLGACLRSANAAGVHAVIIPKDRAVHLTPVVYKIASGAANITPCIPVTNLARTMTQLKDRGIWIYGASDEVSQSIFEADLKGAIAWVLGAEGHGLRRLTRETCDVLFAIPMQGVVSSLNVSVATGICLFEAVRQRMTIPKK